MSPIRDVSEVTRIPRIGKIRLGIKVQGEENKSPYPKAMDYFVCPPEVEEIFGEKPKELEIMFPVEDPDQFAQQWLRRYSLTQGLTCIGDGDLCRRKVDTATGDFVSHTTEEWVWKEDLVCHYEVCPEYTNKRCRRVMNLQFLMPEVPGLGVWQIDTSSFYSIVNINSMIKMLKGLFGRCSMLPLTLALGEIEVSPLGIKKKKVYIMHIRQDNIKLADLARMALAPPSRVLLDTPSPGEDEERPDDLFPEDLIIGEYAEVTQQGTSTKKRSTPRKKPIRSKEPEPAPLPPEYLDDNIQQLWIHIKDFLKGDHTPSIAHLQRWFEKHYELIVTEEELNQEYYPERFSKQMLGHLHESLIAYFDMRR